MPDFLWGRWSNGKTLQGRLTGRRSAYHALQPNGSGLMLCEATGEWPILDVMRSVSHGDECRRCHNIVCREVPDA